MGRLLPIHGTAHVLVAREHAHAVRRAHHALVAEQQTLARWGAHSVDLNLCINDLEELLVRVTDAFGDERTAA